MKGTDSVDRWGERRWYVLEVGGAGKNKEGVRKLGRTEESHYRFFFFFALGIEPRGA